MPRLQRAKILIVSTKAGLRADFVGKGFLYPTEKALLESFNRADNACVIEKIPVDEESDWNSELFRTLNAFMLAISADAVTDKIEKLLLRIYEAGLAAKK